MINKYLYAISNTCRICSGSPDTNRDNILRPISTIIPEMKTEVSTAIYVPLRTPFSDSLIFLCAKILPYIRCNRISIGNGCHLQNSIQLVRCRKSGYKQKAKAIDHILHRKSSHRNDHVLYGKRSPQLQKAADS